jgi:hypothetical protein
MFKNRIFYNINVFAVSDKTDLSIAPFKLGIKI